MKKQKIFFLLSLSPSQSSACVVSLTWMLVGFSARLPQLLSISGWKGKACYAVGTAAEAGVAAGLCLSVHSAAALLNQFPFLPGLPLPAAHRL